MQALLADPRLQSLSTGESKEQSDTVHGQVDNAASDTEGTSSHSGAASTQGSSFSSSVDATMPTQLKKERRRKRDVLKRMFKHRGGNSANSALGHPTANGGSPASPSTHGSTKPMPTVDPLTKQKPTLPTASRLLWPLEEAELQGLLAILKTNCEALGRGLQLDYL